MKAQRCQKRDSKGRFAKRGKRTCFDVAGWPAYRVRHGRMEQYIRPPTAFEVWSGGQPTNTLIKGRGRIALTAKAQRVLDPVASSLSVEAQDWAVRILRAASAERFVPRYSTGLTRQEINFLWHRYAKAARRS